MHRPYLTALLGAWIAVATACVEPGAADAPETSTAEAYIVPVPEEPPCDYITCGRNTRMIGNGQVDHIYFDGTPNDRGQQFVSWRDSLGEELSPVLTSRSLADASHGRLRSGTALTGSVITLVEDNEQVKLRFVDARNTALPNGLSIRVYRLDVWRAATGWRPLCPLFEHTPSDIARYAIPGTREVVHVASRTITAHDPAEGKLTLGCPSSATGKLLSLGALTTTAIAEEESTLPEMRATLLALTLSPLGGKLYTENGVGVMFHVMRTGLDNTGETLTGGLEGKWDADGAICFDRLRGISGEQQWSLWSETHVPPCSEVDLSQHEVLVWTHRYFGIYPEYPPPPPPLGYSP
jgi:hypothetical protein